MACKQLQLPPSPLFNFAWASEVDRRMHAGLGQVVDITPPMILGRIISLYDSSFSVDYTFKNKDVCVIA